MAISMKSSQFYPWVFQNSLDYLPKPIINRLVQWRGFVFIAINSGITLFCYIRCYCEYFFNRRVYVSTLLANSLPKH